MRFSEVVDQAVEFLRRLIDAQHVAREEEGKVLVWAGGTTVVSYQLLPASRRADSEY
jgi:hypothetical protein